MSMLVYPTGLLAGDVGELLQKIQDRFLHDTQDKPYLSEAWEWPDDVAGELRARTLFFEQAFNHLTYVQKDVLIQQMIQQADNLLASEVSQISPSHRCYKTVIAAKVRGWANKKENEYLAKELKVPPCTVNSYSTGLALAAMYGSSRILFQQGYQSKALDYFQFAEGVFTFWLQGTRGFYRKYFAPGEKHTANRESLRLVTNTNALMGLGHIAALDGCLALAPQNDCTTNHRSMIIALGKTIRAEFNSEEGVPVPGVSWPKSWNYGRNLGTGKREDVEDTPHASFTLEFVVALSDETWVKSRLYQAPFFSREQLDAFANVFLSNLVFA